MAQIDSVKTSLQTETIELGGKKRILKFDLNSFAELEVKYGSIQDAMEQLKKGTMKDIRYILWASLIHDEVILDDVGEPIGYKITPFQVGSWITPGMLPELSVKLTQAMNITLPKIDSIPGAKEQLKELGIEFEDPLTKVATIIPTEEEKIAMEKEKEAERKNG